MAKRKRLLSDVELANIQGGVCAWRGCEAEFQGHLPRTGFG